MIVGGIEKDNEMPAAVNMVGEDTHATMDVVEDMKIRGFEWAAVPQYGETTAGPPMVEEEEKEHFMTVGCDPHGDEPTGLDEQWRYFNNVDSTIHDAQPVENIEVEVQKRKRARPIPEFNTECVPGDEAAMVDDYIVPHAIHDKENPVIKEGDIFGDKEEFISTMRTYAIKMSLRLGLNIVTKKYTGQGVEMKTVVGEFLQRNFMVATHSWWSNSQT